MKIRLKNVITGLMLTGASVSCIPKKVPYVETATPFLSKESKIILNNMARESKQKLSDTTYHFFAHDTIKVPIYLETLSDDFIRDIEYGIQNKNPKTIVDSTTREIYYPSTKQYLKHTEYIEKPVFSEPFAVIDNSKFYTRNGQDTYVPVKYYGIPVSNK